MQDRYRGALVRLNCHAPKQTKMVVVVVMMMMMMMKVMHDDLATKMLMMACMQ
jgi:hypothetical protein